MKIKHKILIYNVAALSLSLFIPLLVNNTMAISQTKTTTTNASVRVGNFCSMTANIQPGEEHSATLIGGQYQSDIGKTTIQTFCNDPNGYAIYAIGYTGEDAGVAAGTNTVLHSNALGSTYDIVTGIATSGDTSNWAMKVSSVSGTYAPTIESDIEGLFSNYHTVPSSYTKVAKFNTNTDATIGSSLTTTYAAYISPTQPAGAYEGQVKYILLHPTTETPYHYYMQNVESWGGTLSLGEEIMVYDIRDEKSYTVRRMCMNGTGSTWREKESNCTKSMLWMTQNLDLDLTRDVLLTSNDTDLNVSGSDTYSADYSTDSEGVIYWNPATTTITSINTSMGSFNGWSNNNNTAYSADPDGENQNSWYITGDVYNSYSCYIKNSYQTCNYLKNNNTVALTYFSHTAFASNINRGKIGNYYNWSAAIASNDSSSLTTSTYQNISNNPSNSICPKGWRLPTITNSGEKNEFARLNEVYNDGSTSTGMGLIDFPVFMTRSGYIYDNGVLTLAGFGGYYHSSTVNYSSSAYNLLFNSDYTNPASTNGDNNGRGSGKPIRCVSDY